MLPSDPPHWSSLATPFKMLPKEAEEFELPSKVRCQPAQAGVGGMRVWWVETR